MVIFRGADLAGPLSDTDPHREGLPIAETQPDDPNCFKAQKAAKLIDQSPAGWDLMTASGERFWRALRFGGAGFTLAWMLAQL